jgi:YD repeat-containing protein
MHLGKQFFYQCTIFVLFIASLSSQAQQVVSVNQFTGSAQASIPLWSVNAGPISVPVTLAYNGNGTRAEQSMGNAGLGWNVVAAGQINRKVKDVPDDLNEVGANAKYGWLYGGSASMTESFITTHQNSASYTNLAYDDLSGFGGNENGNSIYDMEPDVFSIYVPGHLSATFSFDVSGAPVLIDNQQLMITPTFDSEDRISAFTIDQSGITYLFEVGTTATRSLEGTYTDENINYFRRAYFLAKGGITYNDVWTLTSITAPTGEQISFNYTTSTSAMQIGGIEIETSLEDYDTLSVYLYDRLLEQYTKQNQFIRKTSYDHVLVLESIETNWEFLLFENNGMLIPVGTYELKYPILNSLFIVDKRSQEARTSYSFNYVSRPKLDTGSNRNARIYLKSLDVLKDIEPISQYSFNYFGINYEVERDFYIDPIAKDPYGFYSPKLGEQGNRKLFIYPDLSGTDRFRTELIPDYSGNVYETDGFTNEHVSVPKLSLGCLKSVVLPRGGREELSYESNVYADETGPTEAYGGGIRVSSIRVHDGVDYNNDQVVTYSYKDDQGNSSGKLLYKPVFYQRFPYHHDSESGAFSYYGNMVSSGVEESSIWRQTMFFTDHDLIEGDSPGYTVGYARVKVEREGIGSVIHEFDIPSDYYDGYQYFNGLGAKMTLDIPSSATNIVCNTGLEKEDFPGANFAFAYRNNGLPLKVQELDAQGQLVGETSYTYSEIGTTTEVRGIKSIPMKARVNYEDGSPHQVNGDSFWYGTYTLDYGSEKVLTNLSRKTYDPSGNQNYVTETTQHIYDSKGKVTQTTNTDREGTKYTTSYKYADSYSLTHSEEDRDEPTQAIGKLVENRQEGQLIEVVSKLEVDGQDQVIGAQLTTWKIDPMSEQAFPFESYAFRTGDPVSNFIESYIYDDGSRDTFAMDSRYRKISIVEQRDRWGNVTSVSGFGGQKTMAEYTNNGRLPSLSVRGALRSEVVFDDFELNYGNLVGSKKSSLLLFISTPGRIFGSSNHLTSQDQLAYNFKLTDPSEYVFSCWLKPDAAGSLTVKIIGTGGVLSQQTIPFVSSSDWTYHQVAIPSFGTSGEEPTLEITTLTDVYVDEVAFYPAYASISFVHYDKFHRKVAETDTYGNTSTLSYDDKGNVKTVRDKDGQLLETYNYSLNSDPEGVSFFIPSQIFEGEPATFRLVGATNCNTFKWKFMSNAAYQADPDELLDFSSGFQTSTGASLTYTFPSVGKWILAVGMDCGDGWELLEVQRRFNVISDDNFEVNLQYCADRKSTIDICQPDADSYISGCSEFRTDQALQLRVEVIGGSGNYSYQWMSFTMENNEILWPTPAYVGSDSPNLMVTNYHDKGYSCLIEDLTTGKEYTTEVKGFFAYASDPQCNSGQ